MTKVGRRASMLAILTTLALVLTSATAFAKGKPAPGTETTNNLSVPAVFVPNVGTFSTLTCGQPAVDPSNTPLPVNGFDGIGIDPADYYYIQGVNKWQAQCLEAAANTVTANADWGDNLTGAPLKAGTPIRVEVGLTDADTSVTMYGYKVVKLQNLLDRESKYGTLATPTTDGSFTATQTLFPYVDSAGATVGVRVFDAGAMLKIATSDGKTIVYDGPATAEINSTGAVVYGYNWGSGKGKAATPAAGTYTLTFTAPNVYLDANGGHTTTLNITVATSGGGSHGR